jgi:hypothetical protein
MNRVYPKAQAPLTWAVLAASNARADRWMRRYYEAVKRIEELEGELNDKDKQVRHNSRNGSKRQATQTIDEPEEVPTLLSEYEDYG